MRNDRRLTQRLLVPFLLLFAAFRTPDAGAAEPGPRAGAPAPSPSPAGEETAGREAGEAGERGVTSLRGLLDAYRYDAVLERTDDTPRPQAQAAARLEALLGRGRLAEAEALLASVGKKMRASSAVWLRLAGALAEARGNFRAAEEACRAAMEAAGAAEAPEAMRARLALTRLYHRLGWRGGVYETTDFFFLFYADVENESLSPLGAYAIGAGAILAEDFENGIRVVALAQKKDPAFLPATVRVGETFLQKYQFRDAEKEFRAALETTPRCAPALAGLAEVLLFKREFREAVKHARRALEIDPGNIGAHIVLAHDRIADEDDAAALRLLEEALERRPRAPELLRFRAAAALLAEDETLYASTRKALLALADPLAAPGAYEGEREAIRGTLDASLHAVASDLLQNRYRLHDAIRHARAAVEADPEYAPGQVQLAIGLMRAGREEEAAPVLDAAMRLDPFNVWVANLRTLLRRDREYRTLETERLRIRLHEKEYPVLAPFLRERADALLARAEGVFGATVSGTNRVSVLKGHADFSARVTGLPRMAATGATFGPFTALVSPRAWLARGDAFNWESVLLHELAHVVTVNASRYRIPRWLTEGMSVYIEGWADPDWDAPFATMMAAGDLPTLATFNRWFHRPRAFYEVPAGYRAAGIAVEALADRFGPGVLPALVRGYGEGKDTATVFREATGLSLADLDAWLQTIWRKRAESIRAPLFADPTRIEEWEAEVQGDSANTNAALHLLRAYRLVRHPRAGDLATTLLRRAEAALDEEESRKTKRLVSEAALVLAEAAMEKKDVESAREALRTAVRMEDANAQAWFRLGLLDLREEKDEAALAKLRKAIERYPGYTFDGPLGHPYRPLVEILVETEERNAAIEALQAYLRHRRNDPWGYRTLAGLLADAGREAEAAEAYRALFGVDPYRREDRLAYARLLDALGEEAAASRARQEAEDLPEAAPPEPPAGKTPSSPFAPEDDAPSPDEPPSPEEEIPWAERAVRRAPPLAAAGTCCAEPSRFPPLFP